MTIIKIMFVAFYIENSTAVSHQKRPFLISCQGKGRRLAINSATAVFVGIGVWAGDVFFM
jgi:hypothetical protein